VPRGPARMQRFARKGPLVDTAHPKAENYGWDGGHNPAAGDANRGCSWTPLPARPTYLICGHVDTKENIAAICAPIAGACQKSPVFAVNPISGRAATLPAEETARALQPSTEIVRNMKAARGGRGTSERSSRMCLNDGCLIPVDRFYLARSDFCGKTDSVLTNRNWLYLRFIGELRF